MCKGVDIPDIKLVVQYRVTCNLDTLYQQFGRGARSLDNEAYAVLLAEQNHFNNVQERNEANCLK